VPKMKTHSGSKKRFVVTANGGVKTKKAKRKGSGEKRYSLMVSESNVPAIRRLRQSPKSRSKNVV